MMRRCYVNLTRPKLPVPGVYKSVRLLGTGTMGKTLGFLTLFLASLIASAQDCSLQSVSLYSDQPFNLRVLFDNSPATSTNVQLYSEDRLVRTLTADHYGTVRLAPLHYGNHRVVIPRKGTLNLIVLPRKSGLNSPEISWFLFPKSKFRWVAGKKVAGRPCPTVALKEE